MRLALRATLRDGRSPAKGDWPTAGLRPSRFPPAKPQLEIPPNPPKQRGEHSPHSRFPAPDSRFPTPD
ncbi:MAG: hypothetical protein F6K56_36890 [Moorea sp. SIO3G5]|nr:hypothetical protein [Moorena sp. SIO3G5]